MLQRTRSVSSAGVGSGFAHELAVEPHHDLTEEVREHQTLGHETFLEVSEY